MKTPRRPLIHPFTPGTSRAVELDAYYYGPIDTASDGSIVSTATPTEDNHGARQAANQAKRELRAARAERDDDGS